MGLAAAAKEEQREERVTSHPVTITQIPGAANRSAGHYSTRRHQGKDCRVDMDSSPISPTVSHPVGNPIAR